jgi:hypothetical protein
VSQKGKMKNLKGNMRTPHTRVILRFSCSLLPLQERRYCIPNHQRQSGNEPVARELERPKPDQ